MKLHCPNCAAEMTSRYPPAWKSENYAESSDVCPRCHGERLARISNPPRVIRSDLAMTPDAATCILHVFFFRIEETLEHLKRLQRNETETRQKRTRAISDETRKIRPIDKIASVVTGIHHERT